MPQGAVPPASRVGRRRRVGVRQQRIDARPNRSTTAHCRRTIAARRTRLGRRQRAATDVVNVRRALRVSTSGTKFRGQHWR